MRKLDRRDGGSLVVFLLLWAVCFALSARTVIREVPYPLTVAGALHADDYPTVETNPTGFATRRGDQVLSINGTDVRGLSLWRFNRVYYDTVVPGQPVRYLIGRGGEQWTDVVTPLSHRIEWPILVMSLPAVLVVLWVSFRIGARSPFFRVGRCAYMVGALVAASRFANSGAEYMAANALLVISFAACSPLYIRLQQLFPDLPDGGRRSRTWPWAFSLTALFPASMWIEWPFSAWVGKVGALSAFAAFLTVAIWIFVRNYGRADSEARRQFRWALFGHYLAAMVVVPAFVAAAFNTKLVPWTHLSVLALLIPIVCIVIAIERSNLYDVDRLITGTATFNILLILFAGVALVVIPTASAALVSAVGMSPAVGQTALSFMLATILLPGQRWLRPRIQRVFFPESHALETGIHDLLDDLNSSGSSGDLVNRVSKRLDQLIQPQSFAVYVRTGSRFVPAFQGGRVVPANFDASERWIAELEAAHQAVEIANWNASASEPREDQARLASLGAALVVPVQRSADLVAFICLGAKRSGDVYTSTDRALLGAVARALSRELLRAEESARHDALRRYVPGAVAERIERGGEVELGEREVSVLFVDIRGYTSFAESKQAGEIFSTVSRYTQLVSDIVRRHGGSVVEFNGDGMMVVFGAPEELPSKEGAAVEAGRAILTAMQGELRGLTVGIGVATGPAFVGNIQAVDRMIWTAIGNTTNLAARLQALTRTLDAAMVIDRRTHERSAGGAGDFVLHNNVPIRGRRDPEDIFALPTRAK